MSDDWFDRSYRSDETTPADLDARVLAAARRATRRWTIPAVAAGAFTIAAATLLGVVLTQHELYVAPTNSPPDGSTVTGRNLDLDPAQMGSELVHPQFAPNAVEPITGPPPAALPDGWMEMAEETQVPVVVAPELNCERSVMIGPVGGIGRRDLIQFCFSEGVLHIEIVWDGDASCPSQLQVKTVADPRVTLEKNELVVGATRYRCERGDWITVEESNETG